MSVPSTNVMPLGDLRRPLTGRAAFGTLLASGIFFVFTATKQSTPVYVHAPWVNDPFDTVFSFTMFFVPLVAATVLVQVSLCRKSEPLPTGRVATILRGCRIALAAMAIELLSAWVSVALGANRSEWTASTAVLIAHWVLDADIEACFDNIAHSTLLERMRRRIGDKRVLALVKAFLKAGIMSADGKTRDTNTGTPQGGIASPLLANIALSALDEHFCAKWDAHGSSGRRTAHRRRGGATYRIVRYADDFLIMVCGSREHAEALWEEVAAVLAPLGLRMSVAKSRVCHLDEGLDFLGFHIQRRLKKGTGKHYVYTYPSKKALASITGKVRAVTNKRGHRTLADLLRQLNPVVRGWCNYFRFGSSTATFHFLDAFTWRRVTLWLRKQHPGINWRTLRRHYLTGEPGWRPTENGIMLFVPQQVKVTRYRWRGYSIPTPWARTATP